MGVGPASQILDLPLSHRYYSDLVGQETAHKYQTLVYLAGSASAEFFADIGLCPWEAVKVLPAPAPLFCCLLDPITHPRSAGAVRAAW